MFLLFCLLLRCHEGSSVNNFPLCKGRQRRPVAKRHPTCGTSSVLNTRYCGSMNTVSTELCSEQKNFLCAQVGLIDDRHRPATNPVHCASCGAIPSNWKSSRTSTTRLPRRWAPRCGALHS